MSPRTAFLKRHSLVIGISLMYLLTWPVDLSSAGVLPIRFPPFVYVFAGSAFVVASILMTGLTLGRQAVVALLRRFLLWRLGWAWYIALLIIPGMDLLGIYIHAAFTSSTPNFSPVMAPGPGDPSVGTLVWVFPVFLMNVIGNWEEIGWRGFALPRLQNRYSALYSALVVGFIWALWHFPKMIGHSNPVAFSWYIVGVMAKSVLITWVYNGTKGSLLLVTLYHAAWNTAAVFLPIGNFVSPSDIGSFAVIILVEIVVAAIITVVAGPAHLSRTQPKQVQA